MEEREIWAMVDNEVVKIWLQGLLITTNKTTLEELTTEEIHTEIEEVEVTISNERLWAHTDSIHEDNIIILLEYLTILYKMLSYKEV